MYPFLLSQILRGYWFLRPEDVIAGQAIVYKLLTGEYNDKSVRSLSDTTPICPNVSDGGSSYDKAPKGSIAIISLRGTMLKYGTWSSYGTEEIASQIQKATHHKNIAAIVLDIDSGGGACNAVAPLTDAIGKARSAGKPVVASCDLAASAAYWVASSCNKIVANNGISSEFGSIGVMCSFADARPVYEKMGYQFHEIYADQSTNKNEDFNLALKGDYSLIKQESLNPLAITFQESVKANRPNLRTDIPGLLSGKMFYAKPALEAGLIDEIGSLTRAVDLARDLSRDAIIHNYILS